MSNQTSDNYHSPLAEKVIAELRLEASAKVEMCEDCGIPLTPGALPNGTPTLGCDECGFSWDMEGNDYEPSEKAKGDNTLPSPAAAPPSPTLAALYAIEQEAAYAMEFAPEVCATVFASIADRARLAAAEERAEIARLQATNASLLAALERIAASDIVRASTVIARAAIASAKEGK